MITFLESRQPDFQQHLARLLKREEAANPAIAATVQGILADVKQRGDAAVAEYTTRFDRLPPQPDGSYRLPPERLAKARVSAEVEAALTYAAERIHHYHHKQLPTDADWMTREGIRLGWRWTALDAVGLYVPGGTASYPSSVLMNAIPAKVAGVARLAITVPAPDGVLNDAVLVAARLAGVDELYTIGGAQACAALAFGTKTITKVDKITGPGNAYVAEAKRQLFGIVGIDTIAGPSEILIIADASNNPDWLACDLLSQAEHDTMASAILITDSPELATAVTAALATQLASLPRAAIAGQSLKQHGAVILVKHLEEVAEIANQIASEHLELAVEHPDNLLPHIRHAGAIFLGRHTPEALGDYIAGPSHVLPTSGASRFSSGLGVLDFMKRTSLIGYSPDALEATGHHAATLANSEQLEAHRRSVTIRTTAA